MSVSLSPPMFLQFFNPNNSGAPAAGYQLFTYIANTSTKQSTWSDSTQTVTNANPIILDSNGAAYVWLDPTLTYKFVFTSPNDTDPPASPIRSEDNISPSVSAASLTQAFLGALLYPRTAAEIAAGVTPVNFAYAPGILDRLATNTAPGTTDLSAAFTAANNVWLQGGAGITLQANEIYYAASSLTISAPITFLPGAQLKTSAGNVLTLNGAIIAPPNKIFAQSLTGGGVAWASILTGTGLTPGNYTNVPLTGGSGSGAVASFTIYTATSYNVIVTTLGTGYLASDTLSASAANLGGTGSLTFHPFVTQITGSMGGIDLIDRWFGVVADGNSTAGSGTDNQPFFQAAINCAISRNGEANNAQAPNRIITQPGFYKVGSRVNVGDNVNWKGAGKFGSNIFAPTAFADTAGIIAINGGGTYPTTFAGFAVGGQVGGCSGNGIVVTKNATFLEDVWVSALSGTAPSTGIVLSQTTVYLRNWIAELNSIGISITQIGVTVDSGETYQNQVVGINVNNSAASGGPGRVLLSNIRCQADVQGGVLMNNAVQLSLNGVHCVTTATNTFTGGAFMCEGSSNDIVFTGCSARAAATGGTTGAGFNFQNVTNISVNGCEAVLMNGGGLISNGVSGLSINGGAYSQNGNYGIRIIGGDVINIGGFIAASNAFDGVNDNASIAGKHVIGPCLTANNGGWGLNLTAAATSFINSIGNTSEGNVSGAINKAGTIANINVVGNF